MYKARIVFLFLVFFYLNSDFYAMGTNQLLSSGWFHTVWMNGFFDNRQSNQYTRIDHQDSWYQEKLDESLFHLRNLNRKRINVVGKRLASHGFFQVSTIDYLESSDASANMIIGSYPFVTILCRFGDLSGETPQTKSWFEDMMGPSYPGTDHYWRELSYNNANLTGSIVVGWYDLPEPRSYYVYDMNADGREDLDTQRATEDCTSIADPDVFFPDYFGINLMLNFATRGVDWNPQAGSTTLTKDGETKSYGTTWIPPWGFEDPGHLRHEMGHTFGLPHSSGDYGQTYDNGWDVMSSPANLGQHTISYHKDRLGWISSEQKYIALMGSESTINLERLALPQTDSYLMAQIPIMGSITEFYTLEARKLVGYDAQLIGEGVVIHHVDTTRENTLNDRPARVIDSDNNGNPDDEGALWTPGEIFTDEANGITVTINSTTETGFLVTIEVSGSTSYLPLILTENQ